MFVKRASWGSKDFLLHIRTLIAVFERKFQLLDSRSSHHAAHGLSFFFFHLHETFVVFYCRNKSTIMGVAEIQWEEYTKKSFLFSSMTNELNAMMHITHASSSSCCSTLVLLSSYELEAGASSFICHVMFMMRYIHHSCRTVGGWQRHCGGVVALSWEIWKGWNGGFRFYFVLLLLLCLVRYSTFIDVVFLLFFSPQFLFPLFSAVWISC